MSLNISNALFRASTSLAARQPPCVADRQLGMAQGGPGTSFVMQNVDLNILGSPYTLAGPYQLLPQPFYAIMPDGVGQLLSAPIFSVLLPELLSDFSGVCLRPDETQLKA